MGAWSGLPVLLGTSVVGLIIVFIVVILAEIIAKKWAPVIIIGFIASIGILMDYGSIRFGGMKLGGIELIIAVGVMLWPLLFLAMDYLNEFYGPQVAKYAVWAMITGKLAVAAATIWVLFGIPNPVTDESLLEVGKTWNQLMMLSPRLNIASIIAALAAGMFNVFMFNKLRGLTKGKHLWLRNNVSSMSSLVIDSIVFNFGAFLFVLPFDVVVVIAVESLVIYWTTNLIDTLFIYIMRYIKKNGYLGTIKPTEAEKLEIEILKQPATG